MSFRTLKNLTLLCLCSTALAAALLSDATLVQSLSKPETVTISTGVYRISGMLVRSADGTPLASLTVKLFDENGSDQPLAEDVSDPDGRYELAVEHSRLPPGSQQRGERQNFVIRVFNPGGQVIKSPEHHVEMTSDSNARVDFRLRSSEINLTSPSLCGYGRDETLSKVIAQLSGQELIEALRAFSTGAAAGAQLNSAQKELVERLPQEYIPDSCGEGYFSSARSKLEKSGDKAQLKQLKDAVPAPLDKEFVTRHFRVRYTTREQSAVNPQVPKADSELKMPNGESIGYLRASVKDLPGNKVLPPTQVQEVGLIAEHALRRFKEAPFSLKDPIGTGKFDILIQELWAAGATDPHPDARHILINNLNSRYQNFGTVPHELFHRVQYEYNSTPIRSGLYGALREGGARFIEDSFVDEYNRYVFESRKIFHEPAHSLLTAPETCSTPINYAAALFWKYVGEQDEEDTSCKQEPFIGISSYREILEATAGSDPYDTAGLRKAFSRMNRPSSFDEFQHLDRAKTELKSSETAWGNYLIANYMHSADSSPMGERRFIYLEDQDAVMWPYIYWDRNETPVDVRKLAKLGAAVKPYNDLKLSRNSNVSRTMVGQLPYAATYYRITPDKSSTPRMLKLSLSAFEGLNDPLIQILSFDSCGILSDIVRSDQRSYSRTINMTGLSSVVVIVASRTTAGDYTLKLSEVEQGADPMITRWNSRSLTEYEVDPRYEAWEYKSVDLTANSGISNYQGVLPQVNNKLSIRIHNRGNHQAENIEIALDYQPYKLQLDSATSWQPVRNGENVIQTMSGIKLAAAGDDGDSQQLEFDWAPTTAGARGWCVKVTLKTPGDLNSDNNVAIGCFSQLNAEYSKSMRR